jgi:hypothetical protein
VIAEVLTLAALAGAADPACAVTHSTAPLRRYGGRGLWTYLPERGLIEASEHSSGDLSWKFIWSARREYPGGLTVAGTRLDAAGRMTVLTVRWGRTSTGQGGWATAVTFPSPGCWRVTGTAAGARVSLVVRVEETA